MWFILMKIKCAFLSPVIKDLPTCIYVIKQSSSYANNIGKHFGELIYILMVWFSMYSMYNEGIIKHLKLIKYVWLNNKKSEINKIHMTDHR